jgi:hypothetical protein
MNTAEKFGRFVAYAIFTVILIFAWAWVASHAWNLIMPDLFNVPRITMLQAYVANVALALVTFKASKADSDYAFSLAAGFVKCVLTLAVAYIVKFGFM